MKNDDDICDFKRNDPKKKKKADFEDILFEITNFDPHFCNTRIGGGMDPKAQRGRSQFGTLSSHLVPTEANRNTMLQTDAEALEMVGTSRGGNISSSMSSSSSSGNNNKLAGGGGNRNINLAQAVNTSHKNRTILSIGELLFLRDKRAEKWPRKYSPSFLLPNFSTNLNASSKGKEIVNEEIEYRRRILLQGLHCRNFHDRTWPKVLFQSIAVLNRLAYPEPFLRRRFLLNAKKPAGGGGTTYKNMRVQKLVEKREEKEKEKEKELVERERERKENLKKRERERERAREAREENEREEREREKANARLREQDVLFFFLISP